MTKKCNTYNDIDKVIGNKIYKERSKRRLTRLEVGRYIDVSGQQISKYEKNINRISASRLFILAKCFNMNINDFL